MDVKPLTAYAEPQYPTRPAADDDPELLRRMPQRWRGNAVLLAVLAGAGLVAAGAEVAQAVEKAKVVARLAPHFPLGVERPRLRGDVCIPDLLTETDARAIIVDEAKKAGIVFAPNVLMVEKVTIPKSAMPYPAKGETKRIDLVLDGTDAKRKIHYEVVTGEDYRAWSGSAQGPNDWTLDTAVVLHNGLEQRLPEGTTVVFHDDGSKEYLRRQVQDFIVWLKAEGVI